MNQVLGLDQEEGLVLSHIYLYFFCIYYALIKSHTNTPTGSKVHYIHEFFICNIFDEFRKVFCMGQS